MTSPVLESFKNFENLKFDPFDSKDVLLDDSNVSDKNFYNNIKTVDTQYYFPSDLKKLKDFLSQTGSFFEVGLMRETVKVHFTNCHSTQLFINIRVLLIKVVGSSISMYIHDSLNCKSSRNLDINTKNVESLSIELISKNSKNTVLSTIYRPPEGDFKAFNTFLSDIYSISLKSNKHSYVTGDFNLNVLDYNKN